MSKDKTLNVGDEPVVFVPAYVTEQRFGKFADGTRIQGCALTGDAYHLVRRPNGNYVTEDEPYSEVVDWPVWGLFSADLIKNKIERLAKKKTELCFLIGKNAYVQFTNRKRPITPETYALVADAVELEPLGSDVEVVSYNDEQPGVFEEN